MKELTSYYVEGVGAGTVLCYHANSLLLRWTSGVTREVSGLPQVTQLEGSSSGLILRNRESLEMALSTTVGSNNIVRPCGYTAETPGASQPRPADSRTVSWAVS